MSDLATQTVKSVGDAMSTWLERFKNYEPTPEELAREEAYQKEEDEKERRAALKAEENRRIRMHIPDKYRGKTLENYSVKYKSHEKVVKYLCEYAKRETAGMENLIIHGLRGTGKSQMVCAMLQYCRKHRSEYWKMSHILLTAQEGNSPHGKETQLHFLKRLSEVPILVIDEIGRHGDSDFVGRFIFDLLDDRYDNMLPTILISNLPIEGDPSITSYLGLSVMDRINENSLDIPCMWGNYRERVEYEEGEK